MRVGNPPTPRQSMTVQHVFRLVSRKKRKGLTTTKSNGEMNSTTCPQLQIMTRLPVTRCLPLSPAPSHKNLFY